MPYRTVKHRARDEHGREVMVIERIKMIDTSSDMSGGHREFIEGLREFRLSNGEPLNRIEEGKFAHFATGEEYTLVTP